MSKTTLLVYPNPFHAVDHEGKPAGVLPYEPVGNGVTTFDERRFVGATLQAEVLQKFPRGDARENVQRTWFEFSEEPVRVPDSAYYRLAIARGEIFAADAATAALCGIKDTFLEAADLLERSRQEALGDWKRLGHEGAEEEPEALKNFAFGPMKEAVAAREKAKSEEEDAAKKAAAAAAAAESEAKKKKEAEAKAKAEAQGRTARGGE